MDENNQMNNVPQTGVPQASVSTQPTDKSVGPAIGIIIIIALMVLGGLYFWGQRLESKRALETNQVMNEQEVTPGADINQMQTQGTSDETTSIEADLNATNLDELGNEMNSIDAEASAQ